MLSEPDRFGEASVVVEGALVKEVVVCDEGELDDLVGIVGPEAVKDGLETEVFVVWHEHAETVEECSCFQYLTDHHPYASFGVETSYDRLRGITGG